MKSRVRSRLVLLLSLAAAASCARTDVFAPLHPAVSLSPAAATVELGRSQKFTATTEPAGSAVRWSVVTPASGTITQDGIYTAPDALGAGASMAIVDVRATLTAYPTIHADASVTVVPHGSPAAVKLVAMSGGNQQVPPATKLPEPLVAKAVDAHGTGVPGLVVTFASAGGSSEQSVTDASGLAQADPVSPTATGPVITTASGGGLEPISFTDVVVSGPVAKLTATDGTDAGRVGQPIADPLVLSFADAWGNPVPDARAAVTSPAGATAAAQAASSGADGMLDYAITLGPTAGTQTFAFAAVADPSVTTSFDFQAHAGPPASLVISSGDAQKGPVGTAVPLPLVVEALDSGGFPAPGATLTWSTPDGGTFASPPDAQTGLDGTASAHFTLPTTAGLVRVTCSSPNLAGSPVTFALQAQAGAAQRLELVAGDGQSTTVGTRFGGAFSVRVTDAYSNGVGTIPVHFEAVTAGSGSVSPADELSGAAGLTQAMLTAGSAPGSIQFRACSCGSTRCAAPAPGASPCSASAQLFGSPITITGTAVAPITPTIEAFSGGGQAGVAGSQLPQQLVVKVTPPSYVGVVQWAVSVGDGTVIPATSAIAGGLASTTVTLGSQVGHQQFSASLAGAVGSPVYFDETATRRPVALLKVIAGDGQQGAPGVALPAPLVVLALDSMGQPVAGAPITFAAPGDGAVNPASTTTDANGQAQTQATLGSAEGTQSFTATADSGATASFTETAVGSVDTLFLKITGGQGQTAQVGQTLAQGLEVTVTNGLGQPVPDETVSFTAQAPLATVAATQSSPAAATLSVATDQNGKASVIATLGQTQGAEQFVATLAGALGSPATYTETATAAPPDHLEIVGGDGQSALAGSALPKKLTVRAVDRLGNPKSGVAIGFRTSDGGSVGTQSATTDSNGLAATTATLGPKVGPETFFADASGLPSAVFTENATADLDRISLSPQGLVVDTQASVRYRATAIYTDGTETDVTGEVSWSSSDSAVATVSDAPGSKGVASALEAGTTNIVASFEGKTGQTSLTVNAATLSSIVVLPASPTLVVGSRRAFSAVGTYSDKSVSTVTETATWTSTNPAVATVSDSAGSKGQVTAVSVGTATISATVGGVTGQQLVTVEQAPLVQLEVTPANVAAPAGTGFDFHATATFQDGTVENVTPVATWSSSDTSLLTVENAPAQAGHATFLAPGTADVRATFDGITAKQAVTITTATVVSLSIRPTRVPRLTVHDIFQLGLIATYSDGSIADATTLATWTSSAPQVADVSNAVGSRGEITAIGAGTATITAQLGSVTASVDVQVQDGSLSYIQIVVPGGGGGPGGGWRQNASCPVGGVLQLRAFGIYSNNWQAPADISDQAAWSVADTSVAVVGNGPTLGGVVRCLKQGQTSVTAEYEGKTSSVTLTVTAAALTSMEVAPTSATLAQGDMRPFYATGVYSDGSRRDLTYLATWTSGDTSVLTVSNALSFRGEATALSPGQTTVTATYQGVKGTAAVTVTDATLQLIVVTPANSVQDLQGGGPMGGRTRFVQFSATAVYSDGTTNDVSAQSLWTTSDASVAVVANDPQHQESGWVELTGRGQCEVEATYEGKNGKTTLTVR